MSAFRSGYELTCEWSDAHWVCTRKRAATVG